MYNRCLLSVIFLCDTHDDYTLYNVYYTMYTSHSVLCTRYSVQCIVYTVQCTVYMIHLYNIQYQYFN